MLRCSCLSAFFHICSFIFVIGSYPSSLCPHFPSFSPFSLPSSLLSLRHPSPSSFLHPSSAILLRHPAPSRSPPSHLFPPCAFLLPPPFFILLSPLVSLVWFPSCSFVGPHLHNFTSRDFGLLCVFLCGFVDSAKLRNTFLPSCNEILQSLQISAIIVILR